MTILEFCKKYPYRFRTLEEATIAMQCISSKKPIPLEIIMKPFKIDGEQFVVNPEYVNARYELTICEREPEIVVTETQ